MQKSFDRILVTTIFDIIEAIQEGINNKYVDWITFESFDLYRTAAAFASSIGLTMQYRGSPFGKEVYLFSCNLKSDDAYKTKRDFFMSITKYKMDSKIIEMQLKGML